MQRNRIRGRAALAGVCVALGVLAGGAEVRAGGFLPPPRAPGSDAPGETSPPAPHPPIDVQECMDQYLRNLSRCRSVCCWHLFWFIEFICDHDCLLPCFDRAEETYEACLSSACPSCSD